MGQGVELHDAIREVGFVEQHCCGLKLEAQAVAAAPDPDADGAIAAARLKDVGVALCRLEHRPLHVFR